MKRSDALRVLSHQHHLGLVAARRLRQAARDAGDSRQEEPLAPAVSYFLHAWHTEIQPHFRAEERVLLPALAQAVPPDDPLIVRTLTEHVALRTAVHELERAPATEHRRLARAIGPGLEAHIRFEERVLFPAIETALAGPRLEELGRELLAGEAE